MLPAARTSAVLAGALAVVALAATGCGGDGGDGDGGGAAGDGAPEPAQGSVVADRAQFPRPSGRSMRELIRNLRQGPELAPGVKLLEPGRNRLPFALFESGNRQLGGLEVAIYGARGLDETAHGPYPARFERIEVEARYRSRQTVDDPDSARSIYVADVELPREGGYVLSAVGRLGGRLVATSPIQVMVGRRPSLPRPGERAIRVHTPTKDSVADIESIETRVPPDSMHETDLADALDEGRPVMLLFATPALCRTRVCGPVTDVAEQVKSEYGDRAEFIHMEIYNDNDPSAGVRSQVRAWDLPSEPWAFTIDSDGTVAERLAGAFSAEELRSAVRKALR